MKLSHCLYTICRHQLANVLGLLKRRLINFPALGSMTLDRDDLVLAKTLLEQKEVWFDKEIIENFETRFATWNGSKYAYSFVSGRVALSACIAALELKPHDEVIVPAYTCVVVPNAFKFEGVKPVYTDIELDTYGLDIDEIKKNVTNKTRAILLHHLYGFVCRDYDAIVDFARARNIKVIEDCAQSTGAMYKGIRVGNFGDIAFYSTEQSKVMNTTQGGMAVTNDPILAEKLKRYQDNAPFPTERYVQKILATVIHNYYCVKRSWRFILGDLIQLRYYRYLPLISTTITEAKGIRPDYYGCRMSAVQAKLGINQLEKVDQYNEARRQFSKKWMHWCQKNNYKQPLILDNSLSVCLRYPVLVESEKKTDLNWARSELRINPGVWFVGNFHPNTNIDDRFPNAKIAIMRCINFPTLWSDNDEFNE